MDSDFSKRVKEETDKLTDEYFRRPTSMDYLVVNTIFLRGILFAQENAKRELKKEPETRTEPVDTLDSIASTHKVIIEKVLSDFVPLGKK